MKGVYTKEAIASIVDPLKAISNVFNNTSVHVVFEMEEKSIHISTMNQKKSVYAMYELNADSVIKDYSSDVPEIGIWDVKQFINIFGKYENDIYTDNVKLDCDGKKMVITCGEETTQYNLSQLHLFEDSRSSSRKLKTDALTEATSFDLTGTELKKLLTNINVFEDQDIITLIGKKGEGITVRLSSSQGTVFNQNEMKLANIEVQEDFSLRFPKADFKGLLVCSGSFKFKVYTGKKEVFNASYSRDDYTMNFYFSPLSD